MGLTVKVFTHLTPASDEDYELEVIEQPGLQNTTYEVGYYNGQKCYDFDVPYSTYKAYREALAGLVGVTPLQIWGNPELYRGYDFYEQINFSDNEGAFDHIAGEVLLKAYYRNDKQAREKLSDNEYELYCHFKEAFGLAVDHKGIVDFG